MPFTYPHVFTYSERLGTPAAESPHHVPMPIRKQRNKILRDLAAAKNAEFRRRMIGRTLSVVTLGDGSALSGNCIRVRTAAPHPANSIIEVKVGSLTENGVAEAAALVVLN